MMTSPWNGKLVRGLQSSVWPRRTLLVVALLIAIAMVSIGPEVVKYLVLMIGMTCAFIAVYWEIWQPSIDSPPPDYCTRYHRGSIARVAVSRRGERFYQCSICGARYRRQSWGNPLVGASDPEYDALYSRQQPGSASNTVTPSYTEPVDWGTTVDVLLRKKRIRQITGVGAYARPRTHSLLTQMRKSSMAQLREHWRGLWDSEFDG
jgi:hypothetical protein